MGEVQLAMALETVLAVLTSSPTPDVARTWTREELVSLSLRAHAVVEALGAVSKRLVELSPDPRALCPETGTSA